MSNNNIYNNNNNNNNNNNSNNNNNNDIGGEGNRSCSKSCSKCAKSCKICTIFLHIFTYCSRLSEYDPSEARMSWRSHDSFSLTSNNNNNNNNSDNNNNNNINNNINNITPRIQIKLEIFNFEVLLDKITKKGNFSEIRVT
jgi:hypothetical protein